MEENKKIVSPLPPLDLAEAEKWLLQLEGIVTLERDCGTAGRFIFNNLLLYLHQQKTLDAVAFLEWLQNGIPHIGEENYRAAAGNQIQHLLGQVKMINTVGSCYIHGTDKVH